MKFISWNIDSLKAAIDHTSTRGEMSWSILQTIAQEKPDFIAIQETKLRETGLNNKQQLIFDNLFKEYYSFFNYSSIRLGYSGTLFLSLHKPINIYKPILSVPDNMDSEGRIITLEFNNSFISTVYTPNSGSKLNRLDYRIEWDKAYLKYIKSLDNIKPVIFSGDFNVAHTELDIKNHKTNHHSAGFTDEERNSFSNLINNGFVDTFRYIHPEIDNVYTWWSQISKTSKLNNSGWRIDYYLISNRLSDKIISSNVLNTFDRKDHAPIVLILNDFIL